MPIPAPSAKPQPDGRVEYSYTESDILGHITVITYDHQADLAR